MCTVDVRALTVELSRYLRRAQRGERIIVTDRAHPVAVLGPAGATILLRKVERLLEVGAVRWEGGKPRGAAKPARAAGRTVSDAVIEGRR